MKTEIIYIHQEEIEKATLRVNKGHSSLNQLIEIIQRETYKEKKISVSKEDKQYQ